MMKLGRPGVEITQEVSDSICQRLIGGDSLVAICRDEGMPAASSVYLKMAQDADFRAAIAHAREAQQEVEADRTIDMADAATPEDWQVVKLRIWARQWRAAKLAPKRFGDRVTQTHVGADGGAVATTLAVTSTHRAKALLALISEAEAEGEASEG